MKRFLIILLLLPALTFAQAYKFVRASKFVKEPAGNVVYIAGDGSDSNSGLNINAPIQSLTKLNTMVASGKTIYLKKGFTYTGNLNVSSVSNVNIISYGSGSNPLLTDQVAVTGWVQNGSIWSVQSNNFPDRIYQLFKNGVSQTLGRFPKSTWNTVTAATNNAITDSNITDPTGYWDGATMVSRLYRWYTYKGVVTSQVSTVFNVAINYVTASIQYYPMVNSPYFLQNHVHCLTAEGEWAYDETAKILYYYSSSAPTNMTIGGQSPIMAINNSANVTVNGVDFDKSNKNSMEIIGCGNVTVSNSNFTNCGINAILYTASNNLSFYSNTINGALSSGISSNLYVNYETTLTLAQFAIAPLSFTADVHDNVISNCGLTWGRHVNGQHWGEAIYLGQTDLAHIYYNSVNTMGYTAINFSGKSTVENNYVTDFTRLQCDGGGIYTWQNASTYPYGKLQHGAIIRNNIVDTSTLGNPFDGAPAFTSASCHGIYLDDGCSGYEVYGNTIIKCHMGVFANGDGLVHDNQIVQNYTGTPFYIAGVFPYVNNLPNPLQIYSNTIINLQIADEVILFILSNTDTNNLYIHDNQYHNPEGISFYLGSNILGIRPGSGYKTLAQWVADESRIVWGRFNEVNNNVSNWSLSGKPKTNFIYWITNPSKNPITIQSTDLPYSDYIDLTGTDFGTSRTIQPYQSIILVRKQS